MFAWSVNFTVPRFPGRPSNRETLSPNTFKRSPRVQLSRPFTDLQVAPPASLRCLLALGNLLPNADNSSLLLKPIIEQLHSAQATSIRLYIHTSREPIFHNHTPQHGSSRHP